MKLRDYELEWTQRIKASKSKRVLIVGPTGCGKTVVAVSLIRSAIQQGKRVLFLAHRKELINQARQRLIEHGVNPVSVGIIRSTEPENRAAKIQVASVQTLVRRKMPPADVVFVDEAHHAASVTYLKILRHYPKARVFGLTATPYRLDGKPLGKLFDVIVESVKPSKLIEAGWINRPRVWTVPPEERANLEGVKTTAGDFNVGQLGAVSNKKSLVGSIVDHWNRLAEGLPTVCYAVSVAHAEHIAKSFRRAKVKAAVLSGETPGDKRAELLRMLKDGELQVLVNCMVLTEGWDCPEARCAIVARATMSQPLWFQMCGRIMRPGDRPPIVLDHAGNALWLPLPGEDIDFSLETAIRKKGPVRGAKEKTCPECGNRLFLGCRVCSSCGFEFWTGEPPEEVQGELRETDGSHKTCIDCGKLLCRGSRPKLGRCRPCRGIYLKDLTPRCIMCGKQRCSKQKVAAGGFICKACRFAVSMIPKKTCKDCGSPLCAQSVHRGSVRCGKCAIAARDVSYTNEVCVVCGRQLSVSQSGKRRCSVCRREGRFGVK